MLLACFVKFQGTHKKTDTSGSISHDHVYHADVKKNDFSDDVLENEEEPYIKFELENETDKDISVNTRSNKNEADPF